MSGPIKISIKGLRIEKSIGDSHERKNEVNEGNQADEYDELERTLEESSERRAELIKEPDDIRLSCV
ncbi:5514_t:CDS:2 [Entrophospora sp. SA101]|nr:5514_t:CDS:2 [Entrophospora sp. SA101]